jgi:hypothetical protein
MILVDLLQEMHKKRLVAHEVDTYECVPTTGPMQRNEF